MKSVVLLLVCIAAVTNALYSPSDDVVELTAANFNHKVIQSDELWLVEFYAPWCGHCQSLAPAWKKAATALKGVVKVGAVDMDVHQSVGGPYNVRGFPTIKIFAANKNSPKDYQGGRNAQAIVDAAMSHVKSMVNDRMSGGSSSGGGSKRSGSGSGGSNDVVTLTDSNFEELVLKSDDFWLVEFYAPWCGHCKRLEPEWAKAASELKGKVKLGALDATVHTTMAGRYQVQGYPTIKTFPQGKKSGDAEEYDGGRTADDIVRWALDKSAESIPPPEPKQIVSEDVLNSECENKQLCVVAVLPHILDCQSKCRNAYLKTFTETATKFKKNMWGWLWVEAAAQMELEESLGIGGFGYPAMAVMNIKKMRYSLLMGAFSDSGISEFLRSISFGRGRTVPLNKLPKISKTDPWDGKDGQLPEEEKDEL
ncbi:protein disulfide-isomerase A6 homolog [Tubulanus polymorphus]|uniref:protein disulfide-isomerase A6 homolog n=1 Tax=Tubulanus polymorphus TaxID=672921 RepID=UPI003DA6677E